MAIEELMLDAGLFLECEEPQSELDYYLSVQRAINSGMWSLQGSYGRAMMDAISSGRCLLGPAAARDYWGNLIPSRDDVKEGTKGSISFVEAAMGGDWLFEMEGA
jgi:hypothetical protein